MNSKSMHELTIAEINNAIYFIKTYNFNTIFLCLVLLMLSDEVLILFHTVYVHI